MRVLAGPKKKNLAKGPDGLVPDEGYKRVYDPETNKWTGSHAASDEAFDISQYAGSNDLEYFAEAFAEYYQGGTRLTKPVKDFVEEVLETNRAYYHVELAAVQRVPLGELKGNPKSVYSGLFGRGMGPF